jgi:hypothetical protein
MPVQSFFHEDGFVARPQFHSWFNQELKAFQSAKSTSSKKTT